MSGFEVGLGTAVLLLAASVAMVVGVAIFIAILRQFLFICRPNEILLFSGRKHRLPDGSTVGYKVVLPRAGPCGCRSWRWCPAWTCACSWWRSASPTPTPRAASPSPCRPSPT